MKYTYEKPVITVDAGMAEGVYAASGAPTISLTYLRNDGDWNNGGTNVYTLDLSALNNLSWIISGIDFLPLSVHLFLTSF